MTLSADYHYELPAAAIAQRPLLRRDQCRLAVLDLKAKALSHHRFFELSRFLEAGDLLVLNDSKVLPARVPCRRLSGGAVELLLLNASAEPRREFKCLLKPAAKLKMGEALRCLRGEGAFSFQGPADEPGSYRVHWEGGQGLDADALGELGLAPTPPYIQRPALPGPKQRREDGAKYQTVYAEVAGSAAAPTAGLHFTRRQLRALEARGVGVARVTLHVGAGTFLPVKTARLEEHAMHEEWFKVSAETYRAVKLARDQGRKVLAVGTTALRALESAFAKPGRELTDWQPTRLFILPGYRFHIVNALLSNFHQPGSTLLPLVCTFARDRDFVLQSYKKCLEEGYRFLSYGDACLYLQSL